MQQESQTTERLGIAVERVTGEAWADWCQSYHPSEAREIVWANEIKAVSQTAKHQPGGKVEITVHITPKKMAESAAYYYLFQYKGRGHVAQIDSVS